VFLSHFPCVHSTDFTLWVIERAQAHTLRENKGIERANVFTAVLCHRCKPSSGKKVHTPFASAGLSSPCWLFRRKGNHPPSTFALLFFEVATNSVQVVLEPGRMFLANHPDFFNDRIFRHLSRPSIARHFFSSRRFRFWDGAGLILFSESPSSLWSKP
jgi:hypothetical protein